MTTFPNEKSIDISDTIVLSKDGKTVIGMTKQCAQEDVTVHIPEGVEQIKDGVFRNVAYSNIYIPKTLRKFGNNNLRYPRSTETTVRYHIDEENQYFFQDEDSLYEILADGTYKLLVNTYMGKGEHFILDQTSIIGENAFLCHTNLSSIHFPKALRCIEKCAFSQSGLQELVIPEGVVRIEDAAFSVCKELRSVQLHSSVEYVAKDAFRLCLHLRTIESESNTPRFILSAGMITKVGVNTAVTGNSTANNSTTKTPEKDSFAEYAKKITNYINQEARRFKDRAEDKAAFDAEKHVITITLSFSQKCDSAELLKERVDCAETLQANSPLRIKIDGNMWEALSLNGRSLGDLDPLLARYSVPYLNHISVESCVVAAITPKSKRRNAKFAIGLVTVNIIERKLPEDISEQDLETMARFAYVIEENEARLVRWIGGTSVKNVTLPAMVEEKPVLSLAEVFDEDPLIGNKNEIEKLTIPDGFTHLESGALAHLQKVKKVIIPASVKHISNDVFSGGGDWDLYVNSVVYVAPAGSYADKFLQTYAPKSFDVKVLTVINNDSEEANDELKLLAAFDLEPGETGIVAKFKERHKLSDFDETIVFIPSHAGGQPLRNLSLWNIPYCVEKLIIPASVTNLVDANDEYTFYNNEGMALGAIEVAEDNPTYWSDGSAIFSKDRKTLIRYLAYTQKTYCVPMGTERLSDRAFKNMSNLESLILPSSLKYIGSYAFSGCTSLADVQGLEYVVEIGESVFAGSGPFDKNIPMLIIGTSLLKCNDYSEKVIQVPDGVTRICEYSFGKEYAIDNVEEIILPPSVSELKHSAFNGRKKLKKVNIPEGVVELPSGLFSDCESLEMLHIPASVTNISVSAFPRYYIRMANKLILNDRTTIIKSALRSINVDTDNATYHSANGMLLSKDGTKLLFVPSSIPEEGFEIPNSVTQICEGAFQNNFTLREITIHERVTTIERRAFSNCYNLEKAIFPTRLASIGAYAFSDCAKLTSIVWPKELKRIGDSAFSGCSLNDIILPDTIEHIGSEAFASVKMQKVTLPKSVRTLGSGAFAGVTEIEVYDSIDPDAKNADAGIDWLDGQPNSLVGVIGNRWTDYTITVKSTDTDEIKYKVWMGADKSQRDYRCFLASAWGHNATFAFEKLDQFFSGIRGKHHKLQVALYRLAYPCDLSAEAKAKYENYVKKNKDS